MEDFVTQEFSESFAGENATVDENRSAEIKGSANVLFI